MTCFEPPSPIFGHPSTELPKPPVPYTPGWRFTIKSQMVSAPTPVVQECCINSEEDRKERRQLSPIGRCLLSKTPPPLPGKEGNGTLSLEVIDVVKGGDGHNTQVFTVRVLDG